MTLTDPENSIQHMDSITFWDHDMNYIVKLIYNDPNILVDYFVMHVYKQLKVID